MIPASIGRGIVMLEALGKSMLSVETPNCSSHKR